MILLLAHNVKGQPKNTGTLLGQATNMLQAGQYADALAMLQNVPITDSVYWPAQVLAAKACLAGGQFAQGISIMDNFFNEIRNHHHAAVGVYMALLDSVGAHQKALTFALNRAMVFNMQADLYLHAGYFYERLGQPDSAVAAYQRGVLRNPLLAEGYYRLAQLHHTRRNMALCLPAYTMALLLENNTPRARAALDFLINWAANPSSYAQKQPVPTGLEEAMAVFYSGQTLNVAYTNPANLKEPLANQLYAFVKHLQKPAGNGLLATIYYPFFKQIALEKYFDAFVYYVFSASGHPNVTSWLKKNEKKVTGFYEAGTLHLANLRQKNLQPPFIWQNQKPQAFYQQNQLVAIGYLSHPEANYQNPANRRGQWRLYNPNGGWLATGQYTNKGQPEGLWQHFHDNGQMQAEKHYTEGKPQGRWKYYYTNGLLKQTQEYHQGQRMGQPKSYYPNGKTLLGHSIVNNQNQKTIHLIKYPDQKNAYRYGQNPDGSFFGFVIAYDHQNQMVNYSAGLYQGHLRGIYFALLPNGDTLVRAHYNQDGQPVGLVKHLDTTLLLQHLYYYTPNGNPSGFALLSTTADTLPYHLQKDSGTVFNYPNGKVAAYGQQNSNGLTGLWYWYYANGQLAATITYNNNLPNGVAMYYYAGGNKLMQLNYQNSLLPQTITTYHPNGKTRLNTNNTSPIANGYVTHYHQNGQPKTKHNYQMGMLHGPQTVYYPNGNPAYQFLYLKNTLQTLTTYNHDQSIKTYTAFYDSLKHYKQATIRLPHLTAQTHNLFWHGPYLQTEPNGARLRTGQYYYNQLHGPDTIFYPQTNKPKALATYQYNLLHGNYTEYYPNQQVLTKGTYHRGNKLNIWYSYYPNGRTWQTGKYQLNKKHGWWYYYTPTGQPALGLHYYAGVVTQYANLLSADTLQTTANDEIIIKNKQGQQLININLKGGLPHGTQNYFDTTGRLFYSETFKNGIKINKSINL